MPTPRFLTLDDVAEILAVSWSQAYALVRRKELLAIQIGGRGQWRVEVDELERFIQQKYAEARAGTGGSDGTAEDATEDTAATDVPLADETTALPAGTPSVRGRRNR
jgi:excisionase family DNA binding protein